jgi:hypothetical protein
MSLRNKLMISAMAVVIGMTTVSCKTVPKANHINTRSDAQCTTSMTSVAITTTTTATTESRTTTTETTMTSTSTETEAEATTISDVAIETGAVETTCGGDICHTEPLSGYWDMTYYSATALGHTTPPCGASGNQLIEGYSVACDSLPFGTLIYLDSDYISGTFRVDDCGTGNNHTIDVYYWDNANVPYDFAQAGRVPVTITILE